MMIFGVIDKALRREIYAQEGVGLFDAWNVDTTNLSTVVKKPDIRIIRVDLDGEITAVPSWFASAAATARVAF